MIRLRSCTTADTPLLVHALNECLYHGYRFKVVMSPERFAEDCRLHDVDLSATFLALDENLPVGVTLVARRGGRSWIAGMGVHPTLRGQGLGTELLRQVLERLRQSGASQVELEVLVENEVARRCYTRAGFVAQRRFYCFRGAATRIPWGHQASRVVKAQPARILGQYDALHRARACWQRDLTTLHHRAELLRGLVALQAGRPVATLLYSENAVSDVGWRDGGPALARPLHDLLISAFGPTKPFAIVNVPNDDPLCQVMHDGGFEVYAEQLDMRCAL